MPVRVFQQIAVWFIVFLLVNLPFIFKPLFVIHRCKAREKSTRTGMFALYLTPVVISIILVAVLFNRTLKEGMYFFPQNLLFRCYIFISVN